METGASLHLLSMSHTPRLVLRFLCPWFGPTAGVIIPILQTETEAQRADLECSGSLATGRLLALGLSDSESGLCPSWQTPQEEVLGLEAAAGRGWAGP